MPLSIPQLPQLSNPGRVAIAGGIGLLVMAAAHRAVFKAVGLPGLLGIATAGVAGVAALKGHGGAGAFTRGNPWDIAVAVATLPAVAGEGAASAILDMALPSPSGEVPGEVPQGGAKAGIPLDSPMSKPGVDLAGGSAMPWEVLLPTSTGGV